MLGPALMHAWSVSRRLQWGTRAFFYARDARSVDSLAAKVEVDMTPEMQGQRLALLNDIGKSGLKFVLDYHSARDGVESWQHDLLRAIEEDLPLPRDWDHVPTSVDGWRPTSALELLLDGASDAAMASRRHLYCETKACEAVVDAIWQHVALAGSRPLMVAGPPGCGKATALALFLERYKKALVADGGERGGKALVTGVSTRCVHTTPAELLRGVMRAIKNHFRIDSPALPEAEAELLSHGCLFSWLEMAVSEAPVVVGLDLDGFQDPPGGGTEATRVAAASMAWLTSAQPADANLIVTTAQPSAVATAKDKYHWPIVMMAPMDRADSAAVIERYLGMRGLEFAGKSQERLLQFRDEDVCSPLFLTTLLHDWRGLDHVGWVHDKHVDKLLLSKTVPASKSMGHLVSVMVDRWELEYQIGARQIFGDVLCFLVLARAGCTEADLVGLTKADPASVGAFISTAREMLATQTGVYHIKHHVVHNVIISKYMSNSVDVEAVRAVIIDYFAGMGPENERAALELTYQFKEAGRKPELLDTIKKLGVFNCFFSSGFESELLGYWALFDGDVRSIAEVYRKGLQQLEAAAAEGMTDSEQTKTFGIALSDFAAMGRLLSHLARFLARARQNLAGIEVLQRLVAVEEQLRPGTANVAAVAMRLAHQCWKIGYFAQGLPFAENALKIYNDIYGNESLQVAEASCQVALMHLGMHDLDQADRHMNICLKIREQVQGRDHPAVADALLQMGKISRQLSNVDEAREYELRANRCVRLVCWGQTCHRHFTKTRTS